MGTRSNVGMLQGDGTIRAIYIHFDGYIPYAGVGRKLHYYYNTPDAISKLLDNGWLTTLEPTLAASREHGGSQDTSAFIVTDRDELLCDMNTEYSYVWQDNQWFVHKHTWNNPTGEWEPLASYFLAEPPAKTTAEIDALKASWLQDGCWDIEDTEGFEAYYDDLKAWRLERRAEQIDALHESRKQAEIVAKVEELGIPDNLALAAYILRLENRINELECSHINLTDEVFEQTANTRRRIRAMMD